MPTLIRDFLFAGIPGEEATGAEAGAASCGAGEFACADGSRCVPAAWRCDLRAHCPDASDELNCSQYLAYYMLPDQHQWVRMRPRLACW